MIVTILHWIINCNSIWYENPYWYESVDFSNSCWYNFIQYTILQYIVVCIMWEHLWYIAHSYWNVKCLWHWYCMFLILQSDNNNEVLSNLFSLSLHGTKYRWLDILDTIVLIVTDHTETIIIFIPPSICYSQVHKLLDQKSLGAKAL